MRRRLDGGAGLPGVGAGALGMKIMLAAFVVALAAAAIPSTGLAANECSGIPKCVPVEGPWVQVPATGEVEYELACPGGKGVVAGTDGEGSSTDIRASFDAILGAPVAYGRSTHTAVMFRAVSAHHKAGWFKPFIGCIPLPSSVRNTVASQASPLGAPLDYVARTIAVRPGFQRTVTLTCPVGDSLVDSWSTTASSLTTPPRTGFANAILVQPKLGARQAKLLVSVSETLPRGLGAEVQVGVRCAS
jgi:hypothetical protein